MSKTYTNQEKIGLNDGWRKDDNTNAVEVTIHHKTSQQLDNTNQAANILSYTDSGNS